MTKVELVKVEGYLRRLFKNAEIAVKPRARKTDSAEVFVGDEFIAILSEDKEDGETTYQLNMAILASDIED